MDASWGGKNPQNRYCFNEVVATESTGGSARSFIGLWNYGLSFYSSKFFTIVVGFWRAI